MIENDLKPGKISQETGIEIKKVYNALERGLAPKKVAKAVNAYFPPSLHVHVSLPAAALREENRRLRAERDLCLSALEKHGVDLDQVTA